jgi:hypothetical protein
MQTLELESSGTRPSWDWLVELAQRLDVVIDVLDAHDEPACPVGATLDAAVVRRILTGGEPAIRAAVSAAARSKTPIPLPVEQMQTLCFRLASGGVLVLARRLNAGDSADEVREDLESIGLWLAGAVDASLAQPTAVSVEGYRIVSFRRILHEATARGSLRRVVGAFVEALSVWDDVRVRAYVARAAGGFLEYASSMMAHPSDTDALDEAIVPRSGRTVRLSRADVDRVGLVADPGDVVIVRIVIGTDTSWVLVFSGMINDCVEVRLRVYSDILRESLNDVLTITTTRVVAELARRHASPDEPLNAAAQTALGQLTAAVGGRHAALIVTTAGGRQALAVGNATDPLPPPDRARLDRLIVRSSDAGGVMTVIIDRDHAPFTAFEREIVQAGVAAMHPWVEAALPRANEIERRRNFRPVDAVFDQLATEVVAAGQHASVIVMSIDAQLARPGLLPSWVGRIRGRLRGADRAGMLSDREIAVLLCGASADQAAMVCGRLTQLVESGAGTQEIVHPAIGITTRAPNSSFEGSLVSAARASAAAHR